MPRPEPSRIHGDQINVHGHHNVGKQVFHGSSAELEELGDFMRAIAQALPGSALSEEQKAQFGVVNESFETAATGPAPDVSRAKRLAGVAWTIVRDALSEVLGAFATRLMLP